MNLIFDLLILFEAYEDGAQLLGIAVAVGVSVPSLVYLCNVKERHE